MIKSKHDLFDYWSIPMSKQACRCIKNVKWYQVWLLLLVQILFVFSGLTAILWIFCPKVKKLKKGGELKFISMPTMVSNPDTIYYWGWIYRENHSSYDEANWVYTPVTKKRLKTLMERAK